MPTLPLPALSAAFAVGAALQIPFLLLRRSMPGLLDRLRYQLWVLALTGVSFHAFAGSDFETSLPFRIFSFAAVALTIELAYRALDRLWLERLVDSRGRHLVPQLVRDLLAWLVIASAIFAAGNWAFPSWRLGTWALPSAVISAVLGFALQDVLNNVFAGLALQTETTFDLGDWLWIEHDARQVLEMSWRSTHLRNNLGVNFHEPNANLANREITNLGSGRVPMGFEVEVGVAYDAPPALVRRSLEKAAASSALVAPDPRPVGLLVGFGDAAVVYRIRFWSREVHAVARLMDEVRSRVWYQLHRDGWTIPFPTRTVELAPAAEHRAQKAARDRERALALLEQIDLFAGLPLATRERLAEAAKRVHFDARERLVVEGEAGDSMLLLASGSVAISKSGSEIGAGSVSLATLEAGAYFGEMSLLTGAPRYATVTATGPVEIFVLDRRAVAPILESDPAVADSLSQMLAERTAATQARFEDRKEELARLVATTRHSILSRIRGFFALDKR
jgi:small-conductance mechanosensitive channel/CRP-like cAMP-binding protein